MKPTLNEKFIAYLALLSGLSISAVAVYYSVVGLTAIFSAAVLPIIIMGTTLELSKLVATVWLKQNWKIAPLTIKTYMTTAVIVLMLITSMGIFGFLSKAHNDQNLVSGDVLAKVGIYDEKIKTAKENIESNRKQLKQMDEAVDQVMARSQDEKGADKANAIRKSQSRDRIALAKEIEANQKLVIQLNDEAAPIRAEIRKVDAEVGPIKYIAAFIYGSDPDSSILEKAVTWIIILIVVVFDPLAVILLLASQISFQNFRERENATGPIVEVVEQPIVDAVETVDLEWQEAGPESKYKQDDGPLTETQIDQIKKSVQFKDPGEHPADTLDYQFIDEEYEPEAPGIEVRKEIEPLAQWNSMIAEAEKAVEAEKQEAPSMTYIEQPKSDYVTINGERFSKRAIPAGYVQNEEQKQSGKWQEITNAVKITEQEYIEKAKERREENNPNNPA
jgi:DNA integrity scanning protein DisA with diadenylate cyclase activity